MHLKTKNCYLKTYVEIHEGEKKYIKIRIILFKN